MPTTNTTRPSASSKPVTFSDIISLTQTTSHTYTLDLDDIFCVGTVPNGGYITTAFLMCARQHMRQTHSTLPSADPINLHLEFLRRTATGPATFVVRDVKLGARITNLHLTLRQHRNPSDSTTPTQDEVEGYIALTGLSREEGLSNDTGYTLHPPPLPVDLSALATNTDKNYILRRKDPYGVFRRATLHSQLHLVRPSRRPPGTTFAVFDQWVRFRPLKCKTQTELKAQLHRHEPLPVSSGRWTNDSLGYIVDIFPQINERAINAKLEDSLLESDSVVSDADIQALLSSSSSQTNAPRTFWYPTLLLNLDVKKSLPEEGVEWLFVRVRAKKIHRGRFDLDVEVWDETHELVALSSHANLVLDAGRNMARTDAKEKKGKESKI